MAWSKDFTRHYHANWRDENREHVNAKAREAYAKNREARRATQSKSAKRIYDAMTLEQKAAYAAKQKQSRLRVKYKLTPAQWDALFVKQGSCCATCKTTDPGKTGWATDHCHKTKRVRGILCPACNKALGHVRDIPETLSAMIEYLKVPT